jgi:hypothetical protein
MRIECQSHFNVFYRTYTPTHMLIGTLAKAFPSDIVGRLERRRGRFGDGVGNGSDGFHPRVSCSGLAIEFGLKVIGWCDLPAA